MVGSPATEDGARLLRRAGIPIVETWELPPAPIDAVAGFAITRQASRSRGISLPKAVRIWRSSAATIPGPRGAGTDSRTPALELGAKAPRRLILERNASGSVAALANLPGVDAVFAANDAHAIGFMSGLRTAGLQRPGPAREQPVAVIGLGDLENGQADSACSQHHPRSWRRHRPNRGQADTDPRRAAPCRPRLRARSARQRLSLMARSAIAHVKSAADKLIFGDCRAALWRQHCILAGACTASPLSFVCDSGYLSGRPVPASTKLV